MSNCCEEDCSKIHDCNFIELNFSKNMNFLEHSFGIQLDILEEKFLPQRCNKEAVPSLHSSVTESILIPYKAEKKNFDVSVLIIFVVFILGISFYKYFMICVCGK